MKTIREFAFDVLCLIVLLPVIIFSGVCIAIKLPFDYIRYKTSLYFKIEKQKYSFFAGSSENFKIYNEIAQNNIPIQYIQNP